MWIRKINKSDLKVFISITVLISFAFLISAEALFPDFCHAQEKDIDSKYFKEGMGLFKNSKWKEAMAKFEEAIKEDQLKMANFYKGYCHYLLGDYDKAKYYFDEGKPYEIKQLKEEGISSKIIKFATVDRPTLETEVTEIRKRDPWYKKWYWWTLIALAIGGTAGGIASAGGGGGGGGSTTTTSSGSETGDVPVTW